MLKSILKYAIAPLILVFVIGGAAYISRRASTAQAETPKPSVQVVQLPAGKQFRSATWHCSAAGYCELWLLTKTRKQGEPPTSQDFSNADGTRKYIINEQ